MCFSIHIDSSIDDIINRFHVRFHGNLRNITRGVQNAFTYPYVPAITNDRPEELQFLRWGLIPPWAKDDKIKRYTLNARVETIAKKPAFKRNLNDRCLIIVDGFYEWKWLDPEGRKKQKYFITLPDEFPKPFALGGLYNYWENPVTKEIIPTFTLLTQEAKGILREVHNSRLRMPLILPPGVEKDWLSGNLRDLSEIDIPLVAVEVPAPNKNRELF